MLKLALASALAALAVAPAATAAVPNANANENATVKVCKNLKAQMGASSFNAVFAPQNARAALRNCARREAAAMEQARVNAAQTCREERGTTSASQAAFRTKYGGGANAFGRCVSQTARAANQERRQALVNAARACRTERGTTTESKAAFQAKYGGGRNAFGKCVSALAKAQND